MRMNLAEEFQSFRKITWPMGSWLREERRRTLLLVNIAGILERADEALLPGVYREIGLSLHVSPTQLGSLTLLRSVMQAACYPVAAYLALHHNRAHVIALGAFLWAAATFLVGISSSFFEVALSRGLNGIGLAMVVPAIQSLVADCSEEGKRGVAFGWLQFTSNMGSIIGNAFSVLLASTSLMGIPGWRLSFHIVAFVSVFVGILVRFLCTDPCFSQGFSHSTPRPKGKGLTGVMEGMKRMLEESKNVIRVRTFQIIIAQGVMGSFPWSAMSFVPMWLELIGFTHSGTAILTTIFTAAGSLGGLLGGLMGDSLALHLPNSGRIILSQISSSLFIPLSATLTLLLPDNPSSFMSYAVLFFVMGLTVSWNSAATNNPIFAEIVPERSRTSVYALDRSFESVLASFAPTVVGILAEKLFGYQPLREGASSSASSPYDDRRNAESLSRALFTTMTFPMTLCVLIYSFLYKTYPRDRDAARMESETIKMVEMEHQADIEPQKQISNDTFQSAFSDEGEDHVRLLSVPDSQLHHP